MVLLTTKKAFQIQYILIFTVNDTSFPRDNNSRKLNKKNGKRPRIAWIGAEIVIRNRAHLK